MEKNKRILVTGATGSLGVAVCNHLISKNYNLILTARSTESLCNLSSKLQSDNEPVKYVSSDFCEPNSFERIYNLCSSGLDGLVLMTPKIKATTDCLPADEYWVNLFNKCFVGPLALIRGLLPILRMGKPSKVVIVSGISSVQVLSHYACNNAIRAAWVAQAKSLAFAFGADGIHFNTLSLGGVMTEEFANKLRCEASENGETYENVMAGRVDNVPLKKYASLIDVSQAIEGLLSDFTNHITGLNIICDGGFTRAY